jgi:hypothetical protein
MIGDDQIDVITISVKHGPPLGGGYVRLKLKLEPSPTQIRLAEFRISNTTWLGS